MLETSKFGMEVVINKVSKKKKSINNSRYG